MHEPPHHQYRPRRLAALCGAALAAALFTPVPAAGDAGLTASALAATVETTERVAPVQPAHTPLATGALAQSLISTGMIGIGLAMGGLVIVTHRRRQW